MSDTTELSKRDPSAVTRTGNEPSARRMTITPAVDIYEDSQGVTLWADLPGVTRDKLDVRVHDGNLAIEAEAVVPTPANLRLQHAEVREPRFARTFTLSPDFDTSKIEANLKDGVLKLTIPRRDEARPRRIEVRTG
ncbi:MAG: Hsp20/alpha crystallin family protein [Paraburkholderia tropica]|uniref:Hsp20/alpha crystallin family protein n=1 Tax=Paraburkholderia tagetis TaxID=2913261 RepID=A0A9X1UN14_9BURK|nr:MULTISPECIES: Hsp20/alpha crystallin family protein [Paraburkholderia]MBB2984589.1 HSP20 family molecular chaperone IbpA [Paraburkholderia tropica]MCG5078430.1 Hsp20/alpha crystallin family protein [Paraburkholderia tagetis]